ncbi:MAG TPA: VWA domain-containing protein, partial [Hyphomicrobiaceae bacterium]|nr:VWA domain-containing protein [Hyphomicrobiaceae bacterium]
SGGSASSNNCVYERRQLGFQDSDVYPSGTAALKAQSDLPGSYACPNAVIQPLSDDKALLKTTVDSYQPNGFTAGHLGTAWAWYVISPNWSSVWPTSAQPAGYNDGKTIKVAVLMTDGEYNTHGGKNGFGSLSNSAATATCQSMKAQNIVVYTVGFKLTSGSTAETTLKTCASTQSKFFLAEDGNALKAAFKSIAEDITQLRLSK